jgi:single-stranded DNA-binding protein
MQTRSWEDKDKNTRYKTEVVITEMEMLPSKSDQGGNYGDPPPERGSDAPQHGTAPGAGAAPGAKTYPGQDGSDPDIPF